MLFLAKCCSSNPNQYDKGYQDAWEGKKAPSSFLTTKEEKEGYEQGRGDAWAYDDGYYDGYNKKRPKYLEDPFYMDGYKDGKADKRH